MRFRCQKKLLLFVLVSVGYALLPCFTALVHGQATTVDFARDIRPILSNHCYACHGPDRQGQENDLRLDRRDESVGRAIAPGDPAESELLARITSDDEDLRMPPTGANRVALSADQVALIRQWIEQGADYSEHWAYRAPSRPVPPPVRDTTWAQNEIDNFVLARLEASGYQPSPAADRRTLVRRLSFDLRGLPPTREEVAEFESDASPQAYERLVQRMLASQHFGERMAMRWLDLVRFADTCGYHGDQHRDIDAYRDYVIESFNENKPFDEFTIEQLAGDLLETPQVEQLIGSAYNRLLQTTEEGGAQPKEYRAIYAADRVRNVSSVWLGTTLGCCQCHDHKFDPFTLREFYQMAAFFSDIEEAAVGRQQPTLELPTPEQAQKLSELDQELSDLRERLAQVKESKNACAAGGADGGGNESNGQADGDDAIATLEKAVKELEQQRNSVSSQVRRTLVTVTTSPRTVRVLPRGNWQDDSGSIVESQIPAMLGNLTDKQGARHTRLDLARWIVSSDNPLTARVFVNHLWSIMFGAGLVRTPDDFGSQGQFPTHPDLLDWLAVEFQESGWNVKHVLRLIALSNAYQQSSAPRSELREGDPYNELLARQNRYRLDAEMVRDNALFVSGLLVADVGGASAKPYQPPGYWDQLNFPKRTYQHDPGAQQYRRGVYTYWCRTFLHPSLAAFDAPTREECTAKRTRSNTPLQALVLLNDPSYVEAARVLGTQLVADSRSDDVTMGVDALFDQVLQRSPSDLEQEVLRDVYRHQFDRYTHDPTAARKLLQVGDKEMPEMSEVELAQSAAWTSVARVILNLHETITRY